MPRAAEELPWKEENARLQSSLRMAEEAIRQLMARCEAAQSLCGEKDGELASLRGAAREKEEEYLVWRSEYAVTLSEKEKQLEECRVERLEEKAKESEGALKEQITQLVQCAGVEREEKVKLTIQLDAVELIADEGAVSFRSSRK